jgi:hypothetical protein
MHCIAETANASTPKPNDHYDCSDSDDARPFDVNDRSPKRASRYEGVSFFFSFSSFKKWLCVWAS